ncbi:ATP-binding protein [Actinobacillus equuli subsp. equuli]|uniref:AAA family ATPase n=1 Tax=Actinobacillus equuli TaxID=718 RepID=UPI0024435059|nr:AAA family ATPase [Actinobacillus equuli]WGE54817.1 ATP-binding protein [Actinobacillus equuli subsp. equuli]
MKFFVHSYDSLFYRPRYKAKKRSAITLEKNAVYMEEDYWDDYGFQTQFYLRYNNELGELIDIGFIKIGFIGQEVGKSTHSEIPEVFEKLPDNFFSMGDRAGFYQSIYKLDDLGKNILFALNDIVLNPYILENNKNENVLLTSLLRGISITTIKDQFSRVLNGGALLTDYDFIFSNNYNEDFSYEIDFHVKVGSLPRTNIHVIVGKNGVGKTELFRCMVDTLVKKTNKGNFTNFNLFRRPLDSNYFSKVLHISFSPFDNYEPPKDNNNSLLGISYNYIGFKNIDDLYSYTASSLIESFLDIRKPLWDLAIKLIKDQQLLRLIKVFRYICKQDNKKSFIIENNVYSKEEICILNLVRISSGHFVFILMLSVLIEKLEEKTLILLDEPELHLHPPLLMSFLQITSELLAYKNAIAIISTHSPIVLQEVPRSCIWKMYRTGEFIKFERPEIETYGENINTITRDVFRLELENSGFYRELKNYLYENELTASEVIHHYNDQIGFEGKSYLNILELYKNEKNRGSREQ